MKTITISVDDETYRLYQQRADAAGVPIDEWVAARMAGLAPKPVSEAERIRLRQQWQELMASIDARRSSQNWETPSEPKLTREELHDRDALR